MEFTDAAALNPLVFSLPTPDGGFAFFEVVESPIMAPELAAKFPEIRTYRGQGIENPSDTLRFDWTPQGFHAQVLSPNGTYYIDPYSRANTTLYTSYYKRDYVRQAEFADVWECWTENRVAPAPQEPGYDVRNATPLRTYRTAVAATGEYTTFHGGTVALGQAAIVTAMNRVNGVYETQLAIRMTLVANNNLLVYTNSATDPYTNNNGGTMLTQNQNNITSVIGSANYDIGHVFSTGGGGIAGLGVVCSSANKARGVTGSGSPVGDGFTIDYVAHEMGHQFNADHTFNSCGGQGSIPYEPGSGSTIMAYAGICGATNIQSNSDAYFHSANLTQITAFRNGAGACGTTAATGNTAPTANAGVNRTIPFGTPFTLIGAGADANGDALTYCWEQRDVGAEIPLGTDNGSSAIIRSRNPGTSPNRTIPQLSNLLANTFSAGEILPDAARNLNFRLVSRDNRAAAGGYGSDDMLITVAAAGPFVVTSPNTAVTWSGNQTVTWNVAGTNAAPVNTANVMISLSTDGGNTFGTLLTASTPNDGSEIVSLPNLSTSTARIKVEAVSNIYFDISNTNFTISGPPAPATPTGATATPATVCSGNSSNLTANVGPGEVVDWYTSSCGGVFVGTGSPLAVSPSVNTNYRARARNTSNGQVSTSCALLAVSVSQPPSFTLQPIDAAVADGQPAAFTCAATGSSPLTYQWKKGPDDVINGGNISGATSLSLSINPATVADAGDYTLVVTNPACGSITSDVATLTVTTSCGSPDFDGDGDAGTDLDIEAFFACLGGDCCPTCGSADFDGDGDSGTDLDIEAFFRVLGGGAC